MGPIPRWKQKAKEVARRGINEIVISRGTASGYPRGQRYFVNEIWSTEVTK